MLTSPGLTLFNLRDLDGRDDLDLRVEMLAASTFSLASSSASLLSATTAEADLDVFLDVLGLFRLVIEGAVSSCSSVALRLRSDRDPSKGSPSTMRVLNIECDPGLDVPRCAGSRSRVSLDAEDRLLRTASSS